MLVAGLPECSVGMIVRQKVMGCFERGKEDNIPFYIRGCQEHIAIGKTKPGYHVTIV